MIWSDSDVPSSGNEEENATGSSSESEEENELNEEDIDCNEHLSSDEEEIFGDCGDTC